MTEKRSSKARAIGLWALGVAVLLVAAGILFLWVRPRTVWTDGGAIAVRDKDASLRYVLWSPPERLSDAVNTDGQEFEPSFSADGNELYFVRGLPSESADIYVSRRIEGVWQNAVPVEAVNSERDELGPRLSADGRVLVFYSNREGGEGGHDIWYSRRTENGWGQPVNPGPAINSPQDDYNPALSPDGRRIFFASNRNSAFAKRGSVNWTATVRRLPSATFDLFTAARLPESEGQDSESVGVAFDSAVALDELNTGANESVPSVSPAGDYLYFTSNREGGEGGFDLYRVRLSREEGLPDGEVENVGRQINTIEDEYDPSLSMNGFELVFSSGQTPTGENSDLFISQSREVFVKAGDRPVIGAMWWLLLVALAALFALLFFVRDMDASTLSVLQRCLLLSLLAHLLLVLLFSLFPVITEAIEIVREEAGMEVAVNLRESAEVELKLDTREQRTQLPTSEPAVAPSERMAVETQASPPPVVQPPQLRVPQATVQPSSMTIQPTSTAPPTPPIKSAEALELPKPTVFAEAPRLAMAPQQRVSQVEALLNPSRQPPRPTPTKQAPRAEETLPEAVKLNAEPTRDQSDSIARTPTIDQSMPEAPSVVAEFTPPTFEPTFKESPQVKLPIDANTTPVVELESTPAAESPSLTHVKSDDVNEPTADPLMTTIEVEANTPESPPMASLADISQLDSTPPAATILAEGPAIDAPQLVPDAPAVEPLPDTSAPVRIADDTGPRAEELGVEVGPVSPSASPDADPSDVRLAVPSGTHAPSDSLATAVSIESAITDIVEAPAIDVPLASDDIEINLPGFDLRTQADEQRPSAVARDSDISEPNASIAPPLPDDRLTDQLADSRTRDDVDPLRDLASLAKVTAPTLPAAASDLDPLAVKTSPLHAEPIDGSLGPGELQAPPTLFQRSETHRESMIKKMGGTEESEIAVALALKYLADNQEEGGRWTVIRGNGKRPKKRGRDQHDAALTGLAALCFLGADHTPTKPGPYQQTVASAIDFLISNQKENGDLRNGSNMYGQGIATLAIAEAALMTGDPRYRDAAFKAAEFIVKAQHPQGGWRYSPGEGGDTSVIGWQVMALHSCEQLGYPLPEQTRERARLWFEFVSPMGSLRAGYQKSRGVTPVMTAEAVFTRILLGERFTAKRVDDVGGYLIEHPPDKGKMNFYYCYYGSLALSQLQTDKWKAWNDMTREHLIKHQDKTGNHAGSWNHNSQWGDRGGRVYSTALATLTLEVYYRYLPMYRGNHGGGGGE